MAFPDGGERPGRNLGVAIMHEADMLEALCRYDGSIMAAFTKTLQMLFLIQNKRICELDTLGQLRRLHHRGRPLQ